MTVRVKHSEKTLPTPLRENHMVGYPLLGWVSSGPPFDVEENYLSNLDIFMGKN
jgi:SOS-response transcriptional repressor LexA